MDQETAKILFREGGTLLFLGMPEGSEFGIDYNSWTVGPKFRGVKMIPPGIHFIYYSSRSPTGDTAPRTGFFYDFKQRELLIKKWDKYNEDVLPDDETTEEEKEGYMSSLRDQDKFLGPYPYENYKKWVSMTTYLSSELVTQLQPVCGSITSVTQFQTKSSNSKSRREEAEAQKQLDHKEPSTSDSNSSKPELPKLDTIPGTEIRFTKIPRRYPESASPSEITKYSMDSTYALRTMINTAYNKKETLLLGEIQFSFICFLIGQVYDAFDQWKSLVHMMCGSVEALNCSTDLYMNFISMLHFQVQDIPEDFFVDIVSTNNFLTSTLQEFFSNLEDGNGESKLRQRGLKFRDHLTKKFKWDFTSEPDEYAPVIVETT